MGLIIIQVSLLSDFTTWLPNLVPKEYSEKFIMKIDFQKILELSDDIIQKKKEVLGLQKLRNKFQLYEFNL